MGARLCAFAAYQSHTNVNGKSEGACGSVVLRYPQTKVVHVVKKTRCSIYNLPYPRPAVTVLSPISHVPSALSNGEGFIMGERERATAGLGASADSVCSSAASVVISPASIGSRAGSRVVVVRVVMP